MGELIEAQGGVSSFLDRWHSLSPSPDERLNRATVYRWINGQSVPKNGKLLLRLSGLLDVDPFAFIAVPDGDMLAAADDVLRIVQNSSTAPPWLQFVRGFFGRHIAWPPEEIASVYFGRPWCIGEFSHDPTARANYYATILLRRALKSPGGLPQIFHFAYKHPRPYHARWLQYGLVRVQGTSATLHHINGHTGRLERSIPDELVRVETWFGPGPALFRIASLHPFTHSLAAPTESATRALRFPG